MRIRPSSRELVFTYREFQKLGSASVCRRYGWGEDWIDDLLNEQATAAIQSVKVMPGGPPSTV